MGSQKQDLTTRIITQFDNARIEPESLLKVFSPNQRVVIDLLFNSKASLSVRQIRDQFVICAHELVSELIFHEYPEMLPKEIRKNLTGYSAAVPASARYLFKDLKLTSPKTLEAFSKDEVSLLKDRVFNPKPKETKLLREVEKLLTKHKIAKSPGFATIQNTLGSLEQQGVVISVPSESLKTSRLYTLTPLFDSFLSKKGYNANK